MYRTDQVRKLISATTLHKDKTSAVDLFVLEKVELMQIDQLNALVIIVQDVGIGVPVFHHAHGAFLRHPESVSVAVSHKYNRIAAEPYDAEKRGFKLQIEPDIFKRHAAVIRFYVGFAGLLRERERLLSCLRQIN